MQSRTTSLRGHGGTPELQAAGWRVMRITYRQPPGTEGGGGAPPASASAGDAEPLGHQPRLHLAGREPDVGAEVAMQMRLVVVAAFGGDLRPPAAALHAQAVQRVVEADHPRGRLGRDADLLAEAAAEVAAAAA